MNGTRRTCAALALCAIAVGWSAPARAVDPRYSIQEIAPVVGGSSVDSLRLSRNGHVVGNVVLPPDANGVARTKAFLLFRGAYTILGRHADGQSWAADVNDSGDVVVIEQYADPSVVDGIATEYLLYDGGGYTLITGMSALWDLGNGGHVVGEAVDPADPTGQTLAAIWYQGTIVYVGHEVRAALGALGSSATYVNGKGEVVGSWSDGTSSHLFTYIGGVVRQPRDVRELIPAEDLSSVPINDNGLVAGIFTDATGLNHLGYDSLGSTIDAGTGLRPAADIGYPRGLNAQNDLFGMAGIAQLGFNLGYVFSWADQQMHDIGSLGGEACLHGINDHGDVVGHSNFAGNAGADGQWGPGSIIVSSAAGKILDLNTVIAADSGWFLSEWGGHIDNLGQVMAEQAISTLDGRLAPVLLTPLPRASIVIAGTDAGGGWYSSNVTVTVGATDAVNGVREIQYSVDGGPDAVVVGTTASFQLKETGTHLVRVHGVDSVGRPGSTETAKVSIRKGGGPVITDVVLPHGTTLVPYSRNLAASGGTAPYRFALVAGSLPAGLTLALDGAISGEPSGTGLSELRVQVTDARNNASTSWLSLEVVDPLVANAPAPSNSGYALTSVGGKAPYTWAVDPATPLPKGTILRYATFGGLAVGTPPSADINFIVTDALGVSATTSLNIPVYPAVVITEPTVLTVPVGVAQNRVLEATGGTPPYTWIVNGGYSGEVAPSLYVTWSGELWGTPTTPGTTTFTAVVVDSVGVASDMVTFTVVVE